MKNLSKATILIWTSLAATAAGVLAYRTSGIQMDGVWGELFWMILGVLATTFLLESLLSRDLAKKRRMADAFAFRTFAAEALASMLEIVSRADEQLERRLIGAACEGSRVFADAVDHVSNMETEAAVLEQEAYLRVYLGIKGALERFAYGYIRLFAKTNEEMAETYIELMEMSRRWDYQSVLSNFDRAMRDAQKFGETERIDELRNEFSIAEEAVLATLRDTVALMAKLARRAHSVAPDS